MAPWSIASQKAKDIPISFLENIFSFIFFFFSSEIFSARIFVVVDVTGGSVLQLLSL